MEEVTKERKEQEPTEEQESTEPREMVFDQPGFPPGPAEMLNLPPEHPASKEYKLTHGTTKDE
jgi:hypothetical protein